MVIIEGHTLSTDNHTTLRALKPGQKGLVRSISTSNLKLCSKLLSMGIVAGTLIEVSCTAPFGDPIAIKARGYELSLRCNEAESIIIEPSLA